MGNGVQFELDLAQRDYLTGLANRRGLYDYYNSIDDTETIHAMFIDVDNFKRVNDIYGHSNGDNLLIQIGRMFDNLQDAFSSRIGGDEYVLIFRESHAEDFFTAIAGQLLMQVSNILIRKDILSLISLSIGIVLNQSARQSLDDILSKCDAALYQAKYNGKNQFAIYSDENDAQDITRSIEAEMESALASGQFHVYLQPKVNMITCQIYGAEALSRWIHPIDGIRSPGIYISIFEKNGFISALDMYIFEEVCRIKKSWKGELYEHIPVSFNMSRLHMFDQEFPNQLESIAKRYGVPTNELEVEITEGIFIKDNREMIWMVEKLEEKGFLVSIDDFGSGFSALNLIKDIPVNTIKLDREFLQLSADTSRGKKVIRNILNMCRDLKLDVVTEGIETVEQADFIKSCGCPIVQGFLYSKPIPLDEFKEYAHEHMQNPKEYFEFRLNGNLKSEDGSKEGSYTGQEMTFCDGIFKNSKALEFRGGKPQENVVNLPADIISNDSYTVSMWIRPVHNVVWSSAIYIKFETGFCSIYPLSPDSHSDFRIRDSREITGWYDLPARQLQENRWYQYIFSYNAMTETAITCINDEVVFEMTNVPTNRYVKNIMIGGDVFQPTFVGDICEIKIFNEPKDYDFLRNLHESYVNDENFCIAFESDR